MGIAHSIVTEVEIAAPPTTVRSVFLSWHRYNEWTKVWTIGTKDDSKKPLYLGEGDLINANLKGFSFSPVILENSEELFRWNGSIPYLAHSFHFRPSTKAPGGTTMIQSEDFSGVLAFLMKPFWGNDKTTLKNWREFDQDVKKESERLSSVGN